jgi:hypothetical protein
MKATWGVLSLSPLRLGGEPTDDGGAPSQHREVRLRRQQRARLLVDFPCLFEGALLLARVVEQRGCQPANGVGVVVGDAATGSSVRNHHHIAQPAHLQVGIRQQVDIARVGRLALGQLQQVVDARGRLPFGNQQQRAGDDSVGRARVAERLEAHLVDFVLRVDGVAQQFALVAGVSGAAQARRHAQLLRLQRIRVQPREVFHRFVSFGSAPQAQQGLNLQHARFAVRRVCLEGNARVVQGVVELAVGERRARLLVVIRRALPHAVVNHQAQLLRDALVALQKRDNLQPSLALRVGHGVPLVLVGGAVVHLAQRAVHLELHALDQFLGLHPRDDFHDAFDSRAVVEVDRNRCVRLWLRERACKQRQPTDVPNCLHNGLTIPAPRADSCRV